MAPKILLGLLIIFLGVTFAAQNPQEVTVGYFVGPRYTTYVWVVAVVSFGLGAAAMALAWGVSAFRSGREKGRLRRNVARLEEELAALKKRPLPDEPPVYPVAALRQRQALPPVERPKMLADTGSGPGAEKR
ncbi:MAG: LapA family protein [Nitrospinae bacterium]|nr:LapA family protein [Nitrospinota bacterium]